MSYQFEWAPHGKDGDSVTDVWWLWNSSSDSFFHSVEYYSGTGIGTQEINQSVRLRVHVRTSGKMVVHSFREEGRPEVHGALHSGWPSSSMSFDNIQQVHNLLVKNGDTMITQLCSHLEVADCTRSSIHQILHNVFSFWKTGCEQIFPQFTVRTFLVSFNTVYLLV